MTRHVSDQNAIRAVIEGQARAIHDKDAKAVVSFYAPGSVIFDLAPPLRNPNSGAAGEKALNDWFATWRGPIECETRDFSIIAADGLAFAYGYVRIDGTKVDGTRSGLWARQTLCFKKIDGAWKIMHDHTSVPFNMDGSYKAAVDLEP